MNLRNANTGSKFTRDSGTGSESDSKIFQFLDLPPELRNQIYRAALVCDPMIETSITGREIRELSSRIQLLHVCVQIRSEAHDIFWCENTFRFISHNDNFGLISQWLHHIGLRRAQLIAHALVELHFDNKHIEKVERYVKRYGTRLTNYRVSVSMVSYNIRRVIRLGIAPSSISLIRPEEPRHSFPRSWRYWYRAHKEFNDEVKETLYKVNPRMSQQAQGIANRPLVIEQSDEEFSALEEAYKQRGVDLCPTWRR